MLKGKAERRAK